MTYRDYGPQEPFSEIGARYHERATALSKGAASPVTLSYGPDTYQRLDVYASHQPSGEVLIFAHGGGWTNGYKEWNAFMAAPLTSRGITLVSIGYRLAPEHLFPVGFQDYQAAVAEVWKSIADFGADQSRLFVGGHSAGGHYASLLASDMSWADQYRMDRSALRGVLPISGTYLFGQESGLSMRPRFLGPEGGGTEHRASPILHIPNPPLPHLLAVGEKDFGHLIRQSESMETALRAAGGDVQRLVIAKSDHFEAHYSTSEADSAWVRAAVAWMNAH